MALLWQLLLGSGGHKGQSRTRAWTEASSAVDITSSPLPSRCSSLPVSCSGLSGDISRSPSFA